MKKRNVTIVAGYALLLLLVFHSVWRGAMYFGWDSLREYWPDLVSAKRALGGGELPLWNPYALGGYSLWGDPQASIFAPVNWLCWGLGAIFRSDGAWLIQVKILVNLWVGLVGMHWLARRRTGSELAGILAALVYVFGSPLLVHKNGAYLWPFLYLPWAVLALEVFVAAPTIRAAAAFALALGLCGSAGHPQAFFYDLIVVFAYWAFLLAAEPRKIGAQLVGMAVFAGLAALFLLPVYLPAATAVAASPRSHRGLAYVLQTPLEVRQLIELILPNLDDNWQADIYVGPLALILGAFSVAAATTRAVRWQRVFWWALALFGVLLALGAHGHVLPFLAEHVPGFGLFRIAYRHKLIFGFAIALLAGDGLGELVRGAAPVWARFGVLALCALWIVGAVIARVLGVPATWALVTAGPALVCAALAARDIGRARLWAVGAVAFAAFDLYAAGKLKLDIMQPPPVLAADVPKLERMPGVARDWRFQNDAVLPYHIPYVDDVRELSGFSNPVVLARQEEVDAHPSVGMLAKLNVKYWWTGKAPPGAKSLGNSLYEVPDPVPVARVYSHAETLTPTAIVQRMSAPAALDAALVEAGEAPALPAETFAPVDATVTIYRRNRVEVDVDAPAAGILVLNETFFPGWTADIDGVASPIFRTDYLLRGVVVPAGKSHVVFRFAPRSWWPLFIGFVIALFGSLVLQLRRRRD